MLGQRENQHNSKSRLRVIVEVLKAREEDEVWLCRENEDKFVLILALTLEFHCSVFWSFCWTLLMTPC